MTMNFFKEHWRLILLLCISPIAINIIVLIPSFLPIAGNASTWLTFFGSFSGSAIMAGITLYVLKEQLRQNHNENEQNREDNKLENESNRNLQLKIFKYQQEQLWLDKFREASAHYLLVYSYNDLVDVVNIARKNPYKAFYMIKDLFTRAGNADIELSFIQRNSDAYNQLDKDKTLLFSFYNYVLDDIQSILTIRINDETTTLKDGYDSLTNITEDMREIIYKIIQEMPDDSIENQFNTAILTRIKLIKPCEEKLRDWFGNYIYGEQKRIDKILYSNGTEQNK